MNPARLAQTDAEAGIIEQAPSLEASDEFDPPRPTGYCPTELLGTFTLLMAGHGRCVRSAMMLGDREYAMWQLARAQAFADEDLRRVAAKLFAYLDEPRGLRRSQG